VPLAVTGTPKRLMLWNATLMVVPADYWSLRMTLKVAFTSNTALADAQMVCSGQESDGGEQHGICEKMVNSTLLKLQTQRDLFVKKEF